MRKKAAIAACVLLALAVVTWTWLSWAPEDPLHEAIYYGDLDRAKTFLADGSDVNARSEEGRNCDPEHRSATWYPGATPLTVAAMYGNGIAAGLLVQAGADVNAQDLLGKTPLNWAAIALTGRLSVTDVLVKAGADVNLQDQWGHGPLYYAAMKGRRSLAEMLLAAGADRHAKDTEGFTPLTIAQQLGKEEIVALFGAIGRGEWSYGPSEVVPTRGLPVVRPVFGNK